MQVVNGRQLLWLHRSLPATCCRHAAARGPRSCMVPVRSRDRQAAERVRHSDVLLMLWARQHRREAWQPSSIAPHLMWSNVAAAAGGRLLRQIGQPVTVLSSGGMRSSCGGFGHPLRDLLADDGAQGQATPKVRRHLLCIRLQCARR